LEDFRLPSFTFLIHCVAWPLAALSRPKESSSAKREMRNVARRGRPFLLRLALCLSRGLSASSQTFVALRAGTRGLDHLKLFSALTIARSNHRTIARTLLTPRAVTRHPPLHWSRRRSSVFCVLRCPGAVEARSRAAEAHREKSPRSNPAEGVRDVGARTGAQRSPQRRLYARQPRLDPRKALFRRPEIHRKGEELVYFRNRPGVAGQVDRLDVAPAGLARFDSNGFVPLGPE
jgi:hypothetical protein